MDMVNSFAHDFEQWRLQYYSMTVNAPPEKMGSPVCRNEDPSLVYNVFTIHPDLHGRSDMDIRTEIWCAICDERYFVISSNSSNIESKTTAYDS